MKRTHIKQKQDNIEWLHNAGYKRSEDGSYGGEGKPQIQLTGGTWIAKGSSEEDHHIRALGRTPREAVANWQACVRNAASDLQAIAQRLLQRAEAAQKS